VARALARERPATFPRDGTKRDAELFEADLTRRKRLGQLAQIDAGRQTVAQFAREWWRIHAEPNLATRTRETYAAVFDKHILPRVGGLALRDVTPAVVASLSADMQAAGVGPAATRKALMVLQGILSCAVNWGHVSSKPVVGVRKPSAKRRRAVIPPSPAVVERMRGALLAVGQLRDATLVSVLAYAGLPWSNVRGRTLLIDRAQSDEGLKDTKTGGTRSVRLLAPLAADLAAWRLASGPLVGEALVFPTRDGELWRDHDWANWRRRVFDPLAATAGVSGMRPYDLRHAFCSLLIGEGLSVVEVARQAGHAPTMTLAREHIREARDHRWVGQQHRRHADREREPPLAHQRPVLTLGFCGGVARGWVLRWRSRRPGRRGPTLDGGWCCDDRAQRQLPGVRVKSSASRCSRYSSAVMSPRAKRCARISPGCGALCAAVAVDSPLTP